MATQASRIWQAFAAGQKLKQDREDKEREAEERKLRLAVLKQQQDKIKHDQAVEDFMAKWNFKQGQPADKLPAVDYGSQQSTIPGGSPVRARLEDLSLPNLPMAVPDELGGGVATPQTAEQILQRHILELEKQKQLEQKYTKPTTQFAPPGSVPITTYGDGRQVRGQMIPEKEPTDTSNIKDFKYSQENPAFAEFMQKGKAMTEYQRQSLEMRQKESALRAQRLEQAKLSGELNPKQISTALALSNSLKGHPAYTDMQDVSNGIQGVETGLAQGNGFGDIAAINAFQRMIDPGATVREGDVDLLQSGSAFINKVLSDYPLEKLQTGAKLPDETRKLMLKTATELYARRAKNYNDTVGGQYKKLAESAGLPFELVGTDFQTGDTQTTAPAVGGTFNGKPILKVEKVQ